MVLGLATTLAAAPVAAQSRVDVGVMGGLTLPTNDMGELYKTGYHMGGTVRWKNANWPVGIQFDANYHTMGSEDFRFDGGLDVLSGVVSIAWPVELETSNLVPVLHMGLGVFNLQAKFPRTTEPYGTQTRLGLSFGGGFEWRSYKSRLVPMFDFRVNGIFGGDPREGAMFLLSGGLKYVFGGKRPRG
jgi:hypothetical protein